jgi:Ca2+:H+ antiporter
VSPVARIGLGLLLFVPISLILSLIKASPGWVFLTAALAILPLAGYMGQATEELAKYLGPTVGGLLNATFGNATELIITIFALQKGLVALVQASITGSIIGNILLVLGAAVVAGGVRYERPTFNPTAAGMHSSMMVLSVVALMVPAVFVYASQPPGASAVVTAENAPAEALSLWVAGILILIYLSSLLFSLRTHQALFTVGDMHEKPHWSIRAALGVLTLTTAAVALESELLVGSVEAVSHSLGLTELFIGVIIVPIIGNAAEHATAVVMASRNKMDIALHIAVGSSTQIALFVAPLLVFISLMMGHPMTFIFHRFELVSIAFAVAIACFISLDGETHWLEGLQLLAAYVIIALAFYFVPA